MHFKVTARTILQLGAELISSDAIAFYELIKNAFDAGSKRVEVRVVVRLPQIIIDDALNQLSNNTNSVEASFRNSIIQNVDFEAPGGHELSEELKGDITKQQLILLLKQANYILIKDQGQGMSLEDLEDIYLTIGTRNRRKERELNKIIEKDQRPILGEKGLGRLSVMRLGEGLKVETTQAGEHNYSILEIDWTQFSHDSDALLESISVEPKKGSKKIDPLTKGTSIFIYNLRDTWSKDKVNRISREQLGRFIDPFGKTNRDFINLWFNKQPVLLSGIDKVLFNNAHAHVKAELVLDSVGNASLIGQIHYKTYDRHKTFSLTGTHLLGVVGDINAFEILRRLGPFTVELYWYNRQLLTKSQGVIDAAHVKGLVSTWGGGLMVYRDGFRVNPYGGPNDDWLNLDPIALSSPGYKLNRRQVVGKVDISSINNPLLLDQTNREGLRDNAEKQALVSLLQYIVWKELKIFLDFIKLDEKSNIAALSLNEIEKRINSGQQKLRQNINYLVAKYPELGLEKETISEIEGMLLESSNLFKRTKESAKELEDRLITTINLAGMGLMVDVIAHELNRVTHNAIQTINNIQPQELSQHMTSSMNTLKAQLKTLQTRLKVLDPLGPSGRQHKATFDLKKLLYETVDSHSPQFERDKIRLVVEDDGDEKEWNIQAVPGMIVQVIENLISNSVFWLKQEQIFNNLSNSQIKIKIDRADSLIIFSDNGPGIPAVKKEEVFRPFVSTKPPGQGKGLGLYISREIAHFHGAELYLKDESTSEAFLHTFVLDLKNSK
ncbi:MAG: sensor histidine kinase [Janthinobacterium lividum]